MISDKVPPTLHVVHQHILYVERLILSFYSNDLEIHFSNRDLQPVLTRTYM